MKPGAKKLRLQKRQLAYSRLMERRSEIKVQTRKETGGYRCPGSNQR